MPESQSTAPARNDAAAFLDDAPPEQETQAAPQAVPEAGESVASSRLKGILPAVSATDRKAVLASLRDAGAFDTLLARIADSVRGVEIQNRFRKEVEQAKAQAQKGEPLKIDSWINEFIAGLDKNASDARAAEEDTHEKAAKSEKKSDGVSEQDARHAERLKDVRAFDALLSKHPEIDARLKAQGIDLEAEKRAERDRLAAAHPGMA